MHPIHAFGILCFLLCVWMTSCLDGAILYRNPEAGRASSQPCFATAWAAAVNATKVLTSKCPYALYSVSLGPRLEQSSLHPIAEYWGGRTYSLGPHSKSIATHNLTTDSRLLNWAVVIVDDNMLHEQFGGSLHRAAKVVKMSRLHTCSCILICGMRYSVC